MKRHGFRKRFVKKGPKTLTRKVARLARAVRSIRPEIKYYDTYGTPTISTTGATVDIMSGITQGLTDSLRVGDKIKPIGIQLTYSVGGNPASAAASQNVRVLIVQGHNENTTPLTLANVLQSTGAAQSFLTPYNHDQRSKFSVKYDRNQIFCCTATQGWQGANTVKVFKKLNMITAYNAGVASIVDNGLYLMYISDSTTNLPSMIYYLRVWYIDV